MNLHRGVSPMSAPTSQQAERSASAATDPTAGRWAGLWRRGRRTARAIAGAAAGVDFPGYRRPVEVLESRTLFTSLLGGQSLIFQDENGNTVRALLTGPGRAELIGTHFDPSINGGTTALLHDVPATITNPDGTTAEILGGFGGQHGVFPIQAATGVPDSFTQLNGLDVPRGIIALRGITSNTAGVTYAFNEFNTTTGAAQHVVQLNTVNALGNADANTQANLAPAIVAATGAAATTDIAQIVDAD